MSLDGTDIITLCVLLAAAIGVTGAVFAARAIWRQIKHDEAMRLLRGGRQ